MECGWPGTATARRPGCSNCKAAPEVPAGPFGLRARPDGIAVDLTGSLRLQRSGPGPPSRTQHDGYKKFVRPSSHTSLTFFSELAETSSAYLFHHPYREASTQASTLQSSTVQSEREKSTPSRRDAFPDRPCHLLRGARLCQPAGRGRPPPYAVRVLLLQWHAGAWLLGRSGLQPHHSGQMSLHQMPVLGGARRHGRIRPGPMSKPGSRENRTPATANWRTRPLGD